MKVFLSYVSGLFVVVNVVDIPGQTEVGDLHHIILCDQHVPGCQVSVDTLQRTERKKHSFGCCLNHPENVASLMLNEQVRKNQPCKRTFFDAR